MKTYQLKCIAPDVETVTEGRNFPTIDAANDRASDMGSRWIFYPVAVVTGPSQKDPVILSGPRELRPFFGRRLSTLKKWFSGNADMVCGWINGEAPFLSPFPYSN